jgi:hypothetical protein
VSDVRWYFHALDRDLLMRRGFAVGLAAVVLSLALSACGSSPKVERPAFLDTGLGCQLAKFPIS